METYQRLSIARLEQWYHRLKESLFDNVYKLDAKMATSKTPVLFKERKKLNYQGIKEGVVWGRNWDSSWFHLTATIPSNILKKKLVARIDIGGEGLVFDNQGNALQGITNGSMFVSETVGFARDMVHLGKFRNGNKISLWVEGAANSIKGLEQARDPRLDDPNKFGAYTATVTHLEYAVFDEELWNFVMDIDVLVGLARGLELESVRNARVLRELMKATSVYADRRENLPQAKKITDKLLSKKASPSSLTAVSVGHAHIDTGYLWPVTESIRKCARTFSSQIDLLERYSDYVFGASAPLHYQFIKKHYPDIYKKIKKYVAEGRWELQGGMWIESDCNLTSGESLIRQFIHGKNFFMKEFGIEVDSLWMPDVFGYSAALPQIMKKTRTNYFLTQKLSWSQFNNFPHHTFLWEGIDGTQILTHFPPEADYNSFLSPDTRSSKGLICAEKSFIEKDFLDDFIVLFGVGDGGGGPADEMIERGHRMKSLEGVPKVEYASSQELFTRLNKNRHELERWEGELYLEFHRGTLTTQAKIKRYNRKLEFLLQTIEKIMVLAKKSDYPRGDLDRWWKVLLLNQFHDIIPGSSINKVYEVAYKQFEEVFFELNKFIKEKASRLFVKKKGVFTIFNPHSYNVTTMVDVPPKYCGHVLCDKEGRELRIQDNKVMVELSQHSFYSIYVTNKKLTIQKYNNNKLQELILENDLIRYKFDALGNIINIYDKEEKRIVSNERGNVITLFEDRPHTYDAWEIDIFYAQCVQEELTAKDYYVESHGDLYTQITFNYKFGNSVMEQKIVLTTYSKILSFSTKVDWQERHSMLRVSFPVDIKSSYASYDIQYGYLKRSTHDNTSWEKAQFEVCGHKYADISNTEYGVSLLNDCKYGYKVKNNVLSLTLLRSPTYPDPIADRGEHLFDYAIYPHKGDFQESDVIKTSTHFNQPPLIMENVEYSQNNFLPSIDNNEAISLDVIKRGESDNNIYIRLVERKGGKASCRINALNINSYVETDMLEWHEIGRHKKIAKELHFLPFEIKTIKLLSDKS